MDNILLYLLKVTAGTALFYLTYLVFYRKETFYFRNRVILIFSIILPVIIPLLKIPVTIIQTVTTETSNTIVDIPGNDIVPTVSQPIVASSAPLDFVMIIGWIYLVGVLIFLIRSLISLISTYRIISAGVTVSERFPRIVVSDLQHPPFSFFPYAVIPSEVYNSGNYTDILDHESAHLRQCHTFDLLLSEIFIAFQWFNPFAWLIKRSVVLNHEYLADQVSVINRSIKDYQYRLLNIAGEVKTVSLAHTFNSLIKNRIIMINTKPTNRKAVWKTLIVLPAVLILSYAFVEPEYKYVIAENAPLTISEAPLIIQKGVKGTVLNEEGKPLAGVRIQNSKIPDEAFGAKTDQDGRFSLANIQPDESIMVFTYGYKRILLKPDFNTEMTIRLEKDPEFAARQIFVNKQGDAKLPQLVVIDGVISDMDFLNASKELGYNFGIVKMVSGKDATDKYGDKGAAGVYEITTRKKAIEMGLRPPLRRLEPTDFPTFQNQQFNRFTDWVAQNAIYTEEAQRKKLEGWVSVNFNVQLDGTVTDVVSNSGSVNQILVDEIIRVIRNSPKWDSPKNPIIDEPFTSNAIVRFRLPDQILNETPYVVVEQMPMYPGGDVELLNYISKSTSYPEAAKEAKAEGRVIVRFIVTKEGNADGVSVLKGVHPLLNEEAVRVVSTLKGFEPGKQGGEPVNVWYMVPINFVLPKVAVDSVLSHSVRSEVGKNPLVVVNGVVTDKDASQIDSKIIESVHVTKGKAATDLYGEKAKDGVIHIITKKESIGGNTDPNIPFVVVEDMPEFPGGNEAMLKWIANNIKYPEEALIQKTEGKVTVRFVVSSKGKVGEAVVLRSDNQIFNNEALRLVGSMPAWKPGSQNGKKVDVYCMVPLEFRIEQDNSDKPAAREQVVAPFNITRRDGTVSTSVNKIKDTGNEVIIRYFEGEKLSNNKFLVYGSSGKQFTSGYKTGFDNVLFPFNLKLNKTNSNTGPNSRPDIDFECMINEPGKWEITIKTNAEKFPILQREEEKQIVR